MKKLKIIILIIVMFIVVWSTIFSSDYVNAQEYKEPIIFFHVETQEDDNCKCLKYICLFYNIEYYFYLDDTGEMIKNYKVILW